MAGAEKPLAADIAAQLDADLAPAARGPATAILAELARELEDDADRILRCVVFLSTGDLARLAHNAERARQDWRDVISWAEYDRDDRRLHDFSRPFGAP
jgi:hypothetical protein